MGKASILRSGAFRFAILISAIFAIGSSVLLYQVERSVNRYATEVALDGGRNQSAGKDAENIDEADDVDGDCA